MRPRPAIVVSIRCRSGTGGGRDCAGGVAGRSGGVAGRSGGGTGGSGGPALPDGSLQAGDVGDAQLAVRGRQSVHHNKKLMIQIGWRWAGLSSDQLLLPVTLVRDVPPTQHQVTAPHRWNRVENIQGVPWISFHFLVKASFIV